MGLDSVNLQVLSTAGSETEKKNAAKVLRLLERGRHWVLVVLLLSNVIGEDKRGQGERLNTDYDALRPCSQ